MVKNCPSYRTNVAYIKKSGQNLKVVYLGPERARTVLNVFLLFRMCVFGRKLSFDWNFWHFRFFSDIPRIDKQGFRIFLLTSSGKIFGPFLDIQKGTPVVNQVWNRKRPEYLSFIFRERRYNFAKIYRSSKLLPECMALMHIFPSSCKVY